MNSLINLLSIPAEFGESWGVLWIGCQLIGLAQFLSFLRWTQKWMEKRHIFQINIESLLQWANMHLLWINWQTDRCTHKPKLWIGHGGLHGKCYSATWLNLFKKFLLSHFFWLTLVHHYVRNLKETLIFFLSWPYYMTRWWSMSAPF